jgi:hypothetical protein
MHKLSSRFAFAVAATAQSATDYTLIEVAVSVVGIFTIVGLVWYFLRHKEMF